MASALPPPIPLVGEAYAPAVLAAAFEEGFPLEFCASESFSPDFVAGLIREGFIPMATAWMPGRDLLLPKLHLLRACLDPRAVHVTRTARRVSKESVLSVGSAFEEVLGRCVEVHGDEWLRPPLVDVFLELASKGVADGFGLLSFELRRGSRLVAGEFGALVGTCYTSWSGFRLEDGAGTVQLVSTARALARAGVELWDLGMPLRYKEGLGAVVLSRARFLSELRRARASNRAPRFDFLPEDARTLIDASPSDGGSSRA